MCERTDIYICRQDTHTPGTYAHTHTHVCTPLTCSQPPFCCQIQSLRTCGQLTTQEAVLRKDPHPSPQTTALPHMLVVDMATYEATKQQTIQNPRLYTQKTQPTSAPPTHPFCLRVVSMKHGCMAGLHLALR